MPSLDYVATLIADPSLEPLSEARLHEVAQAVEATAPPQWLSQGEAADVAFSAASGANKAKLEALFAGLPFDIIIQPLEGREKRLLLADMDSTLIGQECVDELAEYAGVGERVAAITDRAMRGDVAFEPALRERVALLEGLPETAIAEVIRDRIQLNPGARTLAQTMRARGARVVIVSGGFRPFTGAIADRIGADDHRANALEILRGKLTGKVIEPILGKDAKLAALQEIAAAMGLGLAETLAVGDGANDLAMLRAAGLGVAYHAKPAVAVAAQARLDHGDLTALLYAQGIPRTAFVES